MKTFFHLENIEKNSLMVRNIIITMVIHDAGYRNKLMEQ